MDLFERRKPPTKTVVIHLDGEAAAEVEAIQRQLAEAEAAAVMSNDRTHDERLRELRQRLADATERWRQSATEFTFQAIGRRAFSDLLEAHPPGPDEDELDFDADTFVPALIAAAAVDPPLTPEDAERICVEWSTAEVEALFLAAWQVNRRLTNVPLSVAATAATLSSDRNSTTPPDTASPTPSSPPGTTPTE